MPKHSTPARRVASDEVLAGVVELGATSLSTSPAMLPRVRAALAKRTLRHSEAAAVAALAEASASQARAAAAAALQLERPGTPVA